MRYDDLWREIRALRAAPPGLARENIRRPLFAAATQQSQELMAAAEQAGPASKPLPLFYSLSQAGRAIAAARAADGPWEIVGHGLGVTADADDIANTTLTPVRKKDGSDAYSVVARSVGSELLHSSVTLGAVWASLPELAAEEAMTGGETAAYEIVPSQGGNMHPELSILSWGWTPAAVAIPNVEDGELGDFLARYADTQNWTSYGGWVETTLGGRSGPLVRWELPGEEGRRVVRALEDIATVVDGRWYLRPLLGDPAAAPAPLMSWWALLLALSSLARYHPATWVAALDVDSSAQAVALEECLDLAERRVPELILEALLDTGGGRSRRGSIRR